MSAGYLGQLASMAEPVGAPPPPAAAGIGAAPAIAAPPLAVPEITAPAYDAAHDPAWKGYLDPSDHAFRNMLNGLDDSERQLLRQKLVQFHMMPPPMSTSRAPGTF